MSDDETLESSLDERTRAKLTAIREAATCSFPTCDIEQMLAETVAAYVAPIDAGSD